MKNTIISELRRFRDAEAKGYNYDMEAMAADLMGIEPWMERKTYTLHHGRLVPVSSLRAGKPRQAVRRELRVKKAKCC